MVRLLRRGKIARHGLEPIIGASKACWEVALGLVEAPAFRDWTLIGDLPAGTRQVAEDWAPYADIYLIVVQPSAQSALTARRVASLARQQTPQGAGRAHPPTACNEDRTCITSRSSWVNRCSRPFSPTLPVTRVAGAHLHREVRAGHLAGPDPSLV